MASAPAADAFSQSECRFKLSLDRVLSSDHEVADAQKHEMDDSSARSENWQAISAAALTCSMPSLPRSGFLLGSSRHSSVTTMVPWPSEWIDPPSRWMGASKTGRPLSLSRRRPASKSLSKLGIMAGRPCTVAMAASDAAPVGMTAASRNSVPRRYTSMAYSIPAAIPAARIQVPEHLRQICWRLEETSAAVCGSSRQDWHQLTCAILPGAP